MKSMKDPIPVLVSLSLSDEWVTKIQQLSPRIQLFPIKAQKVEDVPAELWAAAKVLYTSSVLPTPEQAPKLEWIQFHYAGIDHIAQAPILRKPGLVATTLSGAAASQVAEYVLMMLLGWGHHFPELLACQQRAEWPKDRWERFSPRELRGSTVGIVGYGSIGRQVAHILHSFGAQVLATKRDLQQLDDEGYSVEGLGDPPGAFVDRFYPPQALRRMLKECDFVVISLPLTPATCNMIDGEVLRAMKPNAFLVDVSRGGIVDHQALITALREGVIAGAALDVFPQEPLPADSPLWRMPNVIITPHIAGDTPHYDERALALFTTNLQRYLAGMPLLNTFHLDRGY